MKFVGPLLALCAVLCFSAQGALAQTAPSSGGAQAKTCKTSDNVHCASKQKDASLTRICSTNDFKICNAGEIISVDETVGGAGGGLGGAGGGLGGAGGGLGGVGGGLGGVGGGLGLGGGLVGLAGLAGLSAVIVNSNKPASP